MGDRIDDTGYTQKTTQNVDVMLEWLRAYKHAACISVFRLNVLTTSSWGVEEARPFYSKALAAMNKLMPGCRIIANLSSNKM